MSILPLVEQQALTTKQRQQIESRLANYNIPTQILEMAAERCDCTIITGVTRRDSPRKPKICALLAGLNDDAIILLQQIFLECHDSFSNYRFAAFLSSKYNPVSYKFVMDKKITGKSGTEYAFDICIHRRNTEELVVVGMQNSSQQLSDNKSLRRFLTAIEDLCPVCQSLHSAYYSSSYGYKDNPSRLTKHNPIEGKVEVKFLEYKDTIYFESKSASLYR